MKQLDLLWVGLMTALVFTSGADAQERKVTRMSKPMKQTPVVVFVCEHGSAKSVVAAAHFNRMAKERNLQLRAISRGTHPDQALPANTIRGLKADGLEVNGERPRKLSRADVAGAIRVVAFCELPEAYSTAASVEQWNDVPPMSEDYNKFRDLVVERIKRLLTELGSAK